MRKQDDEISHLIEVKKSDDTPAKSFAHFEKFILVAQSLQLVQELNREKTYPSGLEIRNLINWLCKVNLST